MMNIPFNRPYVNVRTIEHVRDVLNSGKLSGDGPVCKDVEARIARLLGTECVSLTTSGTHALEIAMMLLDLRPGDEVITPSFTFVSIANAVIRCGARPVFCEIDPRTLTLDVMDFERRITKRTRAVVPIHYAGVAADMDEICTVARSHRIAIIEDAAQGFNGRYRGKYLGTIGEMGAFSFHDTKNYVSGEGGAFVSNDSALAERAEIIREKGTNRASFIRGEVDKYTWVEHGSSYVLSDILAAVLKSQLDDLDVIQAQRKRIHHSYIEGMSALEQQEKLCLPVIPDYCESNYHIFYVLLRSETQRNSVIGKLKEFGIGATFHYVPLHSAPYARKVLGTRDVVLPVTDRIAGTLLRLPIYPQLTEAEVAYVVEHLTEILR